MPGLLTEMAAGITHQALHTHPRPRAAGYLRDVMIADNVLPARDEQLATAERLLTRTLAGIADATDRRLVNAYATWRVSNHQP